MPDYVYAVHDFQPEHDDEISFRTGERIHVTERDDQYGDGWWSGINAAGKLGLFPQSYTSPTPPPGFAAIPEPKLAPIQQEEHRPVHLQPLHEVPEVESLSSSPAVPFTTPNVQTNGNYFPLRTEDQKGEVMQATMSDVQRAIEQLGRGKSSAAQSINFSFTSEKDTDRETDTDIETSEADPHDENWAKQARFKLAEKARRAVEEAERMDEISHPVRNTAPPIQVELSDESEGEDEDMTRKFQRLAHRIPEEDEADRSNAASPEAQHVVALSTNHLEPGTATATRSSFPAVISSSPVSDPEVSVPVFDDHSTLTLRQVPSPQSELMVPDSSQTLERNYTPIRESFIALPSPSPSSIAGFGSPTIGSAINGTTTNGSTTNGSTANGSKHSSTASSTRQGSSFFASGTSIVSPSTSVGPMVSSPTTEQPQKGRGVSKAHPSEWALEDVIEWLKARGFDQDVCDKFIEQEITGDVLLDLDVNLLKTEIGIIAFGKRVRIANAVAELRRPPSINYPESLPASPSNTRQSPYAQPSPQYTTQLHSRNASISHSIQSSVGSPLSTTGYSHGGLSAIMSPESPPHAGDVPASPVLKIPEPTNTVEEARTPVAKPVQPAVGLGIDLSLSPLPLNEQVKVLKEKSRPPQLVLSPSDGALSTTAKAVGITEEEEKGVMSEGELPNPTSMRRRLFGRAQDSASLKEKSPLGGRSKGSIDGSISTSSSMTPDSAKPKSSPARSVSTRRQRSLDGGKSGDRLSIFGGISGSLGKNRKPPPRYSITGQDDLLAQQGKEKDKLSSMSLSRFYPSSSTKSKNGRPATSDGARSVSHDAKSQLRADSAKKDSQLLRKRTSSYGTAVVVDPNQLPEPDHGPVDPMKMGQSILKQIGEPDFSGWMRKKGDRYNHWKMRYFVLKGPHLYCLRSNSLSETKIKGYVNIVGYKVVVDENVNPGKYGFRIIHDHDKTHFFSHDEKMVIRDWMKAIMKATIGRDYTKAVVSSCNIPTIPLTVAQAMNPAPRPPSPTAREAAQKAMRRENPHQLSSRDARILMGIPGTGENREDRTSLESFFANGTSGNTSTNTVQAPKAVAPPRPSRDQRNSVHQLPPVDSDLVEWANSHLPRHLRLNPATGSLGGGLELLRIAESIKGRPASPPVPDSAFPAGPNDDKLDGLFQLFDFFLDNDVKMGSVSINDIRQAQRDKILQLLRALRNWEERRKLVTESISMQSVQAGGFMAPSSPSSSNNGTWTAL